MIRVDDLLIAGKRSFVMGKSSDEFRKVYDMSMQCIERPGDEITFLKRHHALHPDGRLTIHTHHKHVLQLCSLLGLNAKNQNKKSPAHADINLEDKSEDLPSSDATTFRTCVGILMYLPNDLPHCQYVIRYLSTYSSKPTQKSQTVLRHLVSYLAGHASISMSLKWCGRTSGIFHAYPDVQSQRMLPKFSQTLTGLQIVKLDEALAAVAFLRRMPYFSASRTQKVVSLSSAEAEVYACSSGSSDAILLARLTGHRTWIYVYTDSSGARGILQRQGVGRLRHLSCRVLWLQALIANGTIRLCSVSGHVSLADIGTKRLLASRLRNLMAVLGLCNKDVGALEGGDDPGRVFIKRENVRALVCALSLLNLKGCNDEGSMDHGWNLFIFTAVLGLVVIFPLMFTVLGWLGTSMEADTAMNVTMEADAAENMTEDVAPDVATAADPVDSSEHSYDIPVSTPLGPGTVTAFTGARSLHESIPVWGGVDESGMPRFNTSFELPAPGDSWSPEAMITWMYERFARRRSNATTDQRMRLYAERMAVLSEVMQGCRSEDPGGRLAASQMTRRRTNISDEESPSYRMFTSQFCTTLDDAERVVAVGQQLVNTIGSASSSSHPAGGRAAASSTHVNAVADAMIRMFSSENAEKKTSESDAEMETASERTRRYGNSELCKVSDPEEWMLCHHGLSDNDSSETLWSG